MMIISDLVSTYRGEGKWFIYVLFDVRSKWAFTSAILKLRRPLKMVKIVVLDLDYRPCKDGVPQWKMLMPQFLIWMLALPSLAFMMAMEMFNNPGKVVAKFCAKYLHQQVKKNDAYAAGDIGTSVQKAYLRMDEMMRGQRGWRELAILGDRLNKFTGMIEGLIWSPKSSDANDQADDWAFEEGPHSDFSGPTSGCTACVAIIRNNKLIVANAGDSRCVISRKGQAHSLSRDHKPDLEIERDRILKAGGFIHAGRVNGSLNLARAIGDMEFKQNKFLPAEKQIITANPDVTTVELCDDDEFIVIACDGIWDCMSNQQLVDFIHEQLQSLKKDIQSNSSVDEQTSPATATATTKPDSTKSKEGDESN
ncbi:putative protein phosphatase 2C 60 [Cucurbita argyrosperma subsp. argyrosperma]|nr:putative protein phosphatase 2C 60 [Cucurbita argyrosperma subsp. argyrosperma]